ncbi:MAG: hypothetical protein ACPGES_07665 [Coraliomargarita sp.]
MKLVPWIITLVPLFTLAPMKSYAQPRSEYNEQQQRNAALNNAWASGAPCKTVDVLGGSAQGPWCAEPTLIAESR